MIRDLDATITAWLSELVPYASISLDAVPDTAVQDRPTLSLTLVDIQEDPSAGTHSWLPQRSEDGTAIGRVPPNRRYRFVYLVSAFASDTLVEHSVLGAVLIGCSFDDVIPEKCLRGVMSECVRMLVVRCAPHRPEAEGHLRWPGWSITRRTSLEIEVLAPLPAAAVQEVPEPPSQFDLRSSGAYSPRQATPPPPRRPVGRITEA